MRAKMLLYRDSTNFTPVWCTVFDGLESLARSVRNTIFFRRRHFAARKAKSGQREVKIHEQHENSELKRRAPKSKVTLTGWIDAPICNRKKRRKSSFGKKVIGKKEEKVFVKVERLSKRILNFQCERSCYRYWKLFRSFNFLKWHLQSEERRKRTFFHKKKLPDKQKKCFMKLKRNNR